MSRQLVRLVLVVALALPLGAVLSSANGSEAPAASHASARDETPGDIRARAKKLVFGMSLHRFMRVATHAKTGTDRHFDWNQNGCSTPSWTQPVTDRWNKVFTKACRRHDFGYRNFGHGLTLASTATMKARIDNNFHDDMYAICAHYDGKGAPYCTSWADDFYSGVRSFGAAWTAFTARQCVAARLCLFDDKGYADRRIALTSSVSDMNDVDFGDKASSAKNYTHVAWMLYDDHGYSDTHHCLKSGYVWSDMGGFSDKTSSAKRLGSDSCPSGSVVVGRPVTLSRG